VIVNNGSRCSELRRLQEQGLWASIISQENLGFAGAVNRGIRFGAERGYRFTFLLNSDALISADGLAALERHLTKPGNECIAACSPMIMCGPEIDFIGGRVQRCGWRSRHIQSLAAASFQQPNEETFLSGCALFCRNEALQEVGYFDEKFFMYWEDCDLSLRLRSAGWKLAVVPEVSVQHSVGGSSGGVANLLMDYYVDRNRFLMWRKHGRGWYSLLLTCKGIVAQILVLPWSERLRKLNTAEALVDGLFGRFGRRNSKLNGKARTWKAFALGILTMAAFPLRALIRAKRYTSSLAISTKSSNFASVHLR
jgi:hypothetical protein